jgi:hypothetical protein
MIRDHANVYNYAEYNTAAATDGNYHVLLHIQATSNTGYLYLDGVLVCSDTTDNTAAYTFQNFTLGAIRRDATQSSPFLGTLSTALMGIGSTPDPNGLYLDLIGGHFNGTHPAISGSAASLLSGI